MMLNRVSASVVVTAFVVTLMVPSARADEAPASIPFHEGAPTTQPAALSAGGNGAGHASAAIEPMSRLARGPSTQPLSIDQSIRKGVAYLLASQNSDGSWGTGTETRGFEVMAAVPGSHEGFRQATTALCVMALREAGETAAHDRGLDFLIDHGDSRRADGMLLYNTWGHMYAVQALSVELEKAKDDRQKARIRAAVEHQLERLGQYETYMGGWNYYDFNAQAAAPSMAPTSFGTAAGAVALWEARQAGVTVPQRMIDRALHRLAEARLGNGAYLYGNDYKYIPRLPANQPRGSVGRTQACNFALFLWGEPRVNEAQAREGLDFFFKEHEYIQMGRKRQYPHESWYQTAPYYYYFGHYYTARLIEKLGPEARAKYGARLAEDGILPYQEDDGSWWDFAMWDYHKPYGTAFSIMTLLRCK